MSRAATDRRYNASDKGRERRQRYDASDKGRERRQRYDASDKGRERSRRSSQKYSESIRGYTKRRERDLLSQRARVEKELACLEATNC